jgi:predicted aldo/keto reductase-like oxidoreductase
MEMRKYKQSEEAVSLLGFGLMRLPLKEGTGEIDKPQAREMVDYAIARGINYFDTAYMYHEGQSESFAGEALAGYDRSSFKLVTKMPLVFLKSPADVERIFNEQLVKCRTEYFDFYLLHNMSREHLRIAEACGVYEQLKEKQRQGKIGRLGFSFHDRPELLRELTGKYDWDFAQIQLNYLDWDLQNAGEEYGILADKGIPVNVMEPVRGGTLARLCEASLRLFKEANPAVSAASWALRFAASLPGVLTVLSGMSDMSQMRDNVSTMENFKPLSEDEYAVIEKALTAFKASATIPCTGCRYCVLSADGSPACPAGVDIPRVLAIYNNYLLGRANKDPMHEFVFDMEYKILGEEKQAQHCLQCGHCTERCPQHIEIPRWMQVIRGFHDGRKSAGNPHANFLKKETGT